MSHRQHRENTGMYRGGVFLIAAGPSHHIDSGPASRGAAPDVEHGNDHEAFDLVPWVLLDALWQGKALVRSGHALALAERSADREALEREHARREEPLPDLVLPVHLSDAKSPRRRQATARLASA
jgi:hypothetical protein